MSFNENKQSNQSPPVRWWNAKGCPALLGDSPSVAPIEDALRSDAISRLSLMAIKSGGEVIWNPKKYTFESPKIHNEQISHPIRGDW